MFKSFHLNPALRQKPKFLSNKNNKASFISYLCNLLHDTIVTSNCDTMVVECSLQVCSDHGKNDEIMAEDTDILVMLVHRSKILVSQNLYFTTRDRSYDVKNLYESLTLTERERLFFIRAVTGCDTVSGIFGK